MKSHYHLPFFRHTLRRFIHLAVALIAIASLTNRVSAASPPYILQHSLPTPDDVQSLAQLGWSCALSGNYAVLGARLDDGAASDGGIVRVFDTTTGTLLHTLTAPLPKANENYGYAVAMSGSKLAVGASSTFNVGVSAVVGRVYIYELAGGSPTVPTMVIENPTPASFDNFGIALAFSGNRLVVGCSADDVGDTDAGSAYVYDLSSATPTVPMVTINNPSPAASDRFGTTIAINGNILAVGSENDEVSVSNAGLAYVFDLASATPSTPLAVLDNPNPTTGDRFAASLAVSGNRVIVGAAQDTYGSPLTKGRAYLFDITSATPTVPALSIDNPVASLNTQFGTSLAIEGNRLVVGDIGIVNSKVAKAYVFDLAGATPTVPVNTMTSPNTDAKDTFGNAVSVSGNHVLVAANTDNTLAPFAGSGYLYDLTSAAPNTPMQLAFAGSATSNSGGESVATSGRWTAVGAPQDDFNVTDAGSVKVYDRTSATPDAPVYTLTKPVIGPHANESFGESIAMSGDLLVVGARGVLAGSSFGGGVVYVFDLAGATPTVPAYTLVNPAPSSGAWFGDAVAVSGTRVAIGATGDDTGATNAGIVYVYDVSSATPTAPMQTIPHPAPVAMENFGTAVAISGNRLVVGIPAGDANAANAGSAYVYDLTSATPTAPTLSLTFPNATANVNFGRSVAIDGMRIVVGASRMESGGSSQEGTVYTYDLTNATPAAPTLVIPHPAPLSYDLFGYSVSISGNRVIVGASGDFVNSDAPGRAFIYDLTSATPAQPIVSLANPTAGVRDAFGRSVCISSDAAVVGAPYADTNGLDQGAAYIFGAPSKNADLKGLVVTSGAISPAFAPGTTVYTANAVAGTSSVSVIATKAHTGATITINGAKAQSGGASASIPLASAVTPIHVVVTAEDEVTTKTYTLSVNLLQLSVLAFAQPVFSVISGSSATQADIVINRSGNLTGPTSCELSSTDGSATSPAHYTAQGNTSVTLANGQSQQHLLIPIAANATTTTAKIFTVNLSNAVSGATIVSPSTAIVAILPPASATDAIKPTVTITAPSNKATLVDTLPVTISGSATDNIGIARVQVSLNGGVSYTDAIVSTVGSATASYTLDVQPLPGLNNLRVRGIDFKGNVSALASRTFTHLHTLTTSVSGPANSGSVSAGFVPTSKRQLGKSYTITATPKSGFVFDGWSVNDMAGTGITPAKAEVPALSFIMRPGLSLTAKFTANPFTSAITGDYSGLIMPSSNQPAGGTIASNATVGFCSAKLTGTGALTGTVKIDGLSFPFTAVCDNTGVARFGKERSTSIAIKRIGKSSLLLALHTDLTGATQQLTGTIIDGVIAKSLITANRHAFNGTTSVVPKNYIKRYTARLPARSSQGQGFTLHDYPQGDGYLTFTINASGSVTITGKLADDTGVSMSGKLSSTNTWPMFQSLYSGKGSIAATAQLDENQADTDATATDILWFRPSQNVQWYPAGWDEGIYIDMLASKYTPSPASVFPGLAATNPTTGNTNLVFKSGLLASTVTKFVNLTTTNVLTKAPLTDASFTFTPKFTTGVLNGTFTHSDNTKPKWQGVLMQKGTNKGGHGYFMSTKPATVNQLGESGAMHWLAK